MKIHLVFNRPPASSDDGLELIAIHDDNGEIIADESFEWTTDRDRETLTLTVVALKEVTK